jgi:hypothetical protein
VPVAYVIEGRIEEDTISGTYTIGADSGPFTFKRHWSKEAAP